MSTTKPPEVVCGKGSREMLSLVSVKNESLNYATLWSVFSLVNFMGQKKPRIAWVAQSVKLRTLWFGS